YYQWEPWALEKMLSGGFVVGSTSDFGRMLTIGESTKRFSYDIARVWDVRSAKELLAIKCPPDSGAAISPDGRRIVVAGENNTARVCDVSSGAELLRIQLPAPCYPRCFSPDGKQFLTV